MFEKGGKMKNKKFQYLKSIEKSKLRVISLFLIGISVCSCEKMKFNSIDNPSTSDDQGKITNVVLPEQATVSVYIEEEETINDVPTANETGFSLNFSDKIVFSDQKVFLTNQNSQKFIDIIGVEDSDNVSGTDDIRFSATCDKDNPSSNNEEKKTRYEQVSFPISVGSHVNVISLIPKEMLLKQLDFFYCSFTFKIKNKVYSLLLQKIKVDSSDEKNYQVSLSKTAEDVGKIKKKKTLSLEELKKLRIYDELEEGLEVERYDLFCNESKVLSIKHNKKKAVLAFKDLMNKNTNQNLITNRQKKETCVFHAISNKDMVIGISPYFRINFSTIPRKQQTLDLSQIKRVKFKKVAREYNDFLHFLNISKMSEIEGIDYSNIDLTLESQCLDLNYFTGVLSKKTRVPLRDKINAMTFFPEELFFLLSLNYSEFLLKKRLIIKKTSLKHKKIGDNPLHPSLKDLMKDLNSSYNNKGNFFIKSVGFLSTPLLFTLNEWNNTNKENKRVTENKKKIEELIELSYELYKEDINKNEDSEKNELAQDKAEFQCTYSLSLKDREKPENIKVFEDTTRRFKIKYHFKNFGHKVKYVGNSKSEKLIVFNFKDLKNWFKDFYISQDTEYLEFRNKVYSEKLYHLKKNNSAQLGNFQITPLEDETWDQMSLKCYMESFKDSYSKNIDDWNFIETHWEASQIDVKKLISLETVLTDANFKEQLKQAKKDKESDDLVTCRLLFYSIEEDQGAILKFFSPEMKFLY